MSISRWTRSLERDAQMHWIARIGTVTAEALAQREGATVASARARLQAITRAGLLARSRPLTGHQALFTPTRAGLRACGLAGVETSRIGAVNAAHMATCAAVAVALERCYPDHVVIGERELRRRERHRRRTLASATLGSGGPGSATLHRPDLVLWPPSAAALPVAVEVELTVKGPERLATICRAWARCRDIAGVLYLAAPAAQRALERALARAHAGDRVIVLGLDVLLAVSSR
jgi:hypothetical protein